VIRPARPDEGERLREIAIASKSHWGYEDSQVRAWAAQGDFSAEGLARKQFLVAEADGRAVGFASLVPEGDLCVLDDLWLEPAWIGRGVGTELFKASLDRARRLEARRIEWEAEPNAVGFYEKMGARYLRDSEPTQLGRVIPVMGLDLE
jgi:N-acetylglutamate synthase-like GNAT family acetyltransferase